LFGSFGALFLCEKKKTVTAMTYLNMLQLYLLPQLEDHQPNVVFQQDVAPPHWVPTAPEFSGRWVRRHGSIPWPPRSLDITPLDFFLWGYVKDIAYKTPVTTLDELKLRIIAVTPQMLENT
jgi:hypothetical protein